VATSLKDLIAPQKTAVITYELQRGVVGDLAVSAQMSDTKSMIASTGRLVAAARNNGVRVVHSMTRYRQDRWGAFKNAPILATGFRWADGLVEGGPGVDLVPELELSDEDFQLHRYHGLGAFGGTELDAMLRNISVTTVCIAGISLNAGVLATAYEAVGLGYSVVIPTDCVYAEPPELMETMAKNVLPWISKVSTSDEIVNAWMDRS
jgi:nicotinamidase-related amidase